MTVRLVPMSQEVFGPYLERLIPAYAADHVLSGRWSKEDSLTESRKEVERLLPKGLATPNEHFLTISAGVPERGVGILWLHIDGSKGFIYDLWIDENQRRKGYGRDAMRALESYATERGVTTLALHVFGHNGPARDLYRSLGYGERDVIMAKDLA
jgi:ribosomal protein S18 acetylase RimI-like enzyme